MATAGLICPDGHADGSRAGYFRLSPRTPVVPPLLARRPAWLVPHTGKRQVHLDCFFPPRRTNMLYRQDDFAQPSKIGVSAQNFFSQLIISVLVGLP